MPENPYQPPKEVGTPTARTDIGKIIVRVFLSTLIAAMLVAIGWDLFVAHVGCFACGISVGVVFVGGLLALHFWLA